MILEHKIKEASKQKIRVLCIVEDEDEKASIQNFRQPREIEEDIEIIRVPATEALKLSENLKISALENHRGLLKHSSDILINAIGETHIIQLLQKISPYEVKVADGLLLAEIFWKLFMEEKSINEKLTKHNKVLGTIMEINRTILSAHPLENILNSILENAVNLLEADAGTVRLVDDENKFLTLLAAYGTVRKPNERKLLINERSVGGRVYLTGQAVAVEDLTHERSYPWELPKTGGYISLLTVPLKLFNHYIGILSIYTRRRRKFTKEDIELACLFSSQVAMVIDMIQSFEEIKLEAITDGLTGLYNHRYFHERLDEEIERARNNGTAVSLLFCDIDNFKAFNDLNGHEAGDYALKEVARIIKNSIRAIDLAARYGGEEFTVILPETEDWGAEYVAERIRNKVAEFSFNTAGAKPSTFLTLSIGIASFPRNAQDKKSLNDKADWAMYYAKRKGKNQVIKFHLNKEAYVRKEAWGTP